MSDIQTSGFCFWPFLSVSNDAANRSAAEGRAPEHREWEGDQRQTLTASQLCLRPVLVSALAQEIPSYKQSRVPKVPSCLFLESWGLFSHGNNSLNVLNGELGSPRAIYKNLFDSWST